MEVLILKSVHKIYECSLAFSSCVWTQLWVQDIYRYSFDPWTMIQQKYLKIGPNSRLPVATRYHLRKNLFCLWSAQQARFASQNLVKVDLRKALIAIKVLSYTQEIIKMRWTAPQSATCVTLLEVPLNHKQRVQLLRRQHGPKKKMDSLQLILAKRWSPFTLTVQGIVGVLAKPNFKSDSMFCVLLMLWNGN